MKEYVLCKYEDGAYEVICIETGARYVRYNTGDVVRFLKDEVVSIRTHDGFSWDHEDWDKARCALDAVADFFTLVR
jgi:hypothetical protein